jgi:hypothetical protein
VVSIRKKLGTRMDIYIGIDPQKILYLLWSIFLDAREFFSQEVHSGKPLPESQLRYTTNFIGVGRITSDIMGVLVDQFGLQRQSQRGKPVSSANISSTGQDMFRPADYVPYQNKELSDNISVLTNPLMTKFLKVMTGALMTHSSLKYEDIRVGNKGACLNFNLLGICSNEKCTYWHTHARPSEDRIKAVKNKLEPAIQAFVSEGGPMQRKANGRAQLD